jgi:hypothetical protein
MICRTTARGNRTQLLTLDRAERIQNNKSFQVRIIKEVICRLMLLYWFFQCMVSVYTDLGVPENLAAGSIRDESSQSVYVFLDLAVRLFIFAP